MSIIFSGSSSQGHTIIEIDKIKYSIEYDRKGERPAGKPAKEKKEGDEKDDYTSNTRNFTEGKEGVQPVPLIACPQPPTIEDFLELIHSIKSNGKTPVVNDFRGEAHLYLRGHAVCIRRVDKEPIQDVENFEQGLADYFDEHPEIKVNPVDEDGNRVILPKIDAPITMTEREIVEACGGKYNRYLVANHDIPSPEVVTSFLQDLDDLLDNIDETNEVAVDHCHGGKGRTATFVYIFLQYYAAKYGIDPEALPKDPMERKLKPKLLKASSSDSSNSEGDDSPNTQNARADFIGKFNAYIEYSQQKDEKPSPDGWRTWLEQLHKVEKPE